MTVRHNTGIRAVVVFLILIIPVGAVFTGTGAKSAALQDQDSQPLPVYQAGTTFVYSNGTWETVTAAELNVVSWKDHRGKTSTGTPDFTRRRLQYRTKTRQGTRVFGPRENITVKGYESIWPLAVGKKASYTERGTWRDKRDGSAHATLPIGVAKSQEPSRLKSRPENLTPGRLSVPATFQAETHGREPGRSQPGTMPLKSAILS